MNNTFEIEALMDEGCPQQQFRPTASGDGGDSPPRLGTRGTWGWFFRFLSAESSGGVSADCPCHGRCSYLPALWIHFTVMTVFARRASSAPRWRSACTTLLFHLNGYAPPIVGRKRF
ncbi:hypothetical protein KCP73_01045 [Salmonella enterica subsp. enterica]|nr:hypothetical protein KCP73_01045 [Salmonella enterica subsp. enterica]